MDLQLAGKRALVTGSNKGIGAGIAECLAAEGVHVVVHGRNRADAQAVVDKIRKDGGKAEVVIGDVGDKAQVEAIARDSLKALGGVDILVNNAANWDLQSWWDTTPEMWIEQFNLHVLSAVRLTHLLVPAMRDRKWGRVINISSGGAITPWAHGPDYHSQKAAMINMTVTLAQNLVHTGVNVTTVSPGPILTPGLEKEFRKAAKLHGGPDPDGDFDAIETWSASYQGGIVPNPTGKIGRPKDIGYAVTFVASPLAGFINGANIRVDGGYIRAVN